MIAHMTDTAVRSLRNFIYSSTTILQIAPLFGSKVVVGAAKNALSFGKESSVLFRHLFGFGHYFAYFALGAWGTAPVFCESLGRCPRHPS